jgi:outer membrane protein assembly factor BamB
MYDADRSPVSSLAQVTFQLLGTDSFDNVSPPVLLYDRRILAVVGQQDLRTMNGDGTLVSNRRLPIRPKFVAVSRRGWFYDVGEKAIYIVDLNSANFVSFSTAGETALEPPTIGNDGSLYVVTNQNIYAFPPPPSGGRPNQAIAPLWRYRTGAGSNNDVSAVALSEDGRTVFVVDKATSQLIALDAATGRPKWSQADIQISRSANEPMPIPVVASDAIFITNQAPTGGVLYIVTDGSSGPSLEKLSGTATTAPVVGPDESAYVIRDGSLQRLRRDPTDQKFTAQNVGGSGCNKLAGFDLLRADQSGDIYGLDRTGARIVYIRSNDMSVPVGVCNPMSVANLGATLAIAPDGTAYNYNQKAKLLALSPLIGDRNTGMSLTNDILKLNPDNTAVTENNETTFRAAGDVKVVGLQLPANADINIVAGKSVSFGPGLRIADGSRLHVHVGFCPAQSTPSECQAPGTGAPGGTSAVAATK